jgi:hypothetical protein
MRKFIKIRKPENNTISQIKMSIESLVIQWSKLKIEYQEQKTK